MEFCKDCGVVLDEEVTINHGTSAAFGLCDACRATRLEAGDVLICEHCGAYFSTDVLQDEVIHGYSFCPCPDCGHDIVEGQSREEFTEEHKPGRYAVIVTHATGTRGYVVSVHGGAGPAEAIRKLLLEKQPVGVLNVAVSEILLDEDIF